MTALDPTQTIAVIGAGTMGAGIAQVAAAAGHPVLLFDAQDGAAARGKDGIAEVLARVVDKGRMTAVGRDALLDRIALAPALTQLAPARLVIEAIVEDLAVKRGLFAGLEAIVGADCILASNTSSLSVTAIGAGLANPARLAGMHFFNPAPLMKLVEIISGLATAADCAQTLFDTATAWGKVAVMAKSTPGFIVNRVARPFYAEGLRLLQEGVTDAATIDAVMREAGGFRMGPFELMDLIGMDVNFAVTNAVHDAYFSDPRYRPNLVQRGLVDAGWLGRKSGRGFFDYGDGAQRPGPATIADQPAPAGIAIEGHLGWAEALAGRIEAGTIASRRTSGTGRIVIDGAVLVPTDGRTATRLVAEGAPPETVVFDLALDLATAPRIAIAVADQAPPGTKQAAAGLLQAMGLAVSLADDAPGLIVMRTVAMLANEASDAVLTGVADGPGIDAAMQAGVNYPKGPLAWAEELGLDRVLGVLQNLFEWYGEDRYRPSSLLRRRVLGGERK